MTNQELKKTAIEVRKGIIEGVHVEEHSCNRRSCTEKSSGGTRRENAGMSSEMKVRILQAEYLRFPE